MQQLDKIYHHTYYVSQVYISYTNGDMCGVTAYPDPTVLSLPWCHCSQLTLMPLFSAYPDPTVLSLPWSHCSQLTLIPLFSAYPDPTVLSLPWCHCSQLTLMPLFSAYPDATVLSLPWCHCSQLTLIPLFSAYPDATVLSLPWCHCSQLTLIPLFSAYPDATVLSQDTRQHLKRLGKLLDGILLQPRTCLQRYATVISMYPAEYIVTVCTQQIVFTDSMHPADTVCWFLQGWNCKSDEDAHNWPKSIVLNPLNLTIIRLTTDTAVNALSATEMIRSLC